MRTAGQPQDAVCLDAVAFDAVVPIPPNIESEQYPSLWYGFAQCRGAADHHGIGMPAVGPLKKNKVFLDVSE